MKKVAIFGQVYKDSHKKSLITLIKCLSAAKVDIHIDADYATEAKKKLSNPTEENINSYFLNEIDTNTIKDINSEGLRLVNEVNTYTATALDTSFDAMITLGGDGTILRAFNQIKDLNIPILGINLGRLGFLATIQENEIEISIATLVNKDFTIDQRAMLQVSSNEKSETFYNLGFALNDITISKKDTNSMIGVDAYLDNNYLTTYWADGLIISTPTGSTGYSLSCQGPVIMPNTNNFLITPVAPHNLNARPIIISDLTEIKLRVLRREDQFLASLDSDVTAIDVETELIVKKAPFSANIITLKDHTFVNTLRDKLLWGQDVRNKFSQQQ